MAVNGSSSTTQASAVTTTTTASQPTRTPKPDGQNDNDLDPAAFLKSVRELSEKREREDAERFRKLEEEVQQGRQQRAARRAERARSISPQKQQQNPPPSPSVHTPTPLSRSSTFDDSASASASASTAISNAKLDSSHMPTMTPPSAANKTSAGGEAEKPTPKADIEPVPDFKGFGSIKRSSATTSNRSSSSSTSGATSGAAIPATTSDAPVHSAPGLARSGTLTWNRRPPSQLTGPRPQSQMGSRPQSRSSQAAENAPTAARTGSIDQTEPSRDQIAASLGARDPSWFKQTPDRGVGSAAYRKSKEESQTFDNFNSTRRGLPGLSRETSAEPENQFSPPSSVSIRSDEVSRGGSVRGSTISAASRFSATSMSSKPDLKALIAEDEVQQQAYPNSDQGSMGSVESTGVARALTMSTSQARLAGGVERPASPTKGMGGFVQSAMMKRSDSQNKRWSAQPGTSMSRSNSVASSRSGLQSSYSMPRLEPTNVTTDPSREPSARPTSSSNHDLSRLVTEHDKDGFVKPARPSHHSRSKSMASNYSTNDDIPHSPGSPSKRFSPVKSTWLESSLTKPESPKVAPVPKNSQPSWMADLASRKAQRGSADDTQSPLAKENGNSRPSSPVKETPFGRDMLRRTGSKDPAMSPASSATPMSALRPLQIGNKVTRPLAATSPTPLPSAKSDEVQTLDEAIDFVTSMKAEVSEERSPAKTEVIPEEHATTPSLPISQPISNGSLTPKPSDESTTPATPIAQTLRDRAKSFKSPALSTPDKSKPEASPKPQMDFRSQLKSRPPRETQTDSQPEFLAKVGALRKTQQEKFVAPDVLKDNIVRGKTGLNQTGGPARTQRRDELRESLLAKKDDWKKAKEEGRELPGAAHERKISETAPVAPVKPEALAKKELLGRSNSNKTVPPPTSRTREGTPEALARHKSIKSRPNNEMPKEVKEAPKTAPSPTRAPSPKLKQTPPKPTQPSPQMRKPSKQASEPVPPPSSVDSEPLSRQISAPMVAEPKPIKETSKLASRFNPALANVLARGPPSQTPSRSGSPGEANGGQPPTSSAEPPAPGAPLQDVRKDRAKGPKRRKAGAKVEDAPSTAPVMEVSVTASSQMGSSLNGDVSPTSKPQPQDKPGSLGSVMRSSLSAKVSAERLSGSKERMLPVTPKAASGVDSASPAPSAVDQTKPAAPEIAVPEFKGFRSTKWQASSDPAVADKETSIALPRVSSVASRWASRMEAQKAEPPLKIPTPSKVDQEAAMKSAGLLAASPGPKVGSSISVVPNGDKSASPGPPPRPAKSSRVVSGQLAEASPNKCDLPTIPDGPPKTEAGKALVSIFKAVPKYREPLAIDTSSTISNREDHNKESRTLRRTVLAVFPDGSSKTLSPQQEYTLYEESVFVCNHGYTTAGGAKPTQIYMWAGRSALDATIEAANGHAKRVSRENDSAPIQLVRQGQETAAFLQAFGGILITRRGALETASKQFSICGRKYLGHIVFDEVDFTPAALCPGFVYLISYPVTLQQTRLYLWKGSACSTEELSAARLAAMDVSETGEIIEVDGGAEFPSFLKIFGPNTRKTDMPKPSPLWLQKSAGKFHTRLFRIQAAPQRTGLMTALWNRRPSWNSTTSPRTPVPDTVKAESKEIVALTPSELDAEGIYLLDAYAELYLLIGPLFHVLPEPVRNALLGQALLFGSDYAIMSASLEDRPRVPKASVVFAGVPRDVRMLLRHWDEARGLWGTASLMAGQAAGMGREPYVLALDDVLNEVCRD